MAAADAIATVSTTARGSASARPRRTSSSTRALLALDDAVEEVFGRVENGARRETKNWRSSRSGSRRRRSAARITGSSGGDRPHPPRRGTPAPTQQPDFERLFYDEAKLGVARGRRVEAAGGRGAGGARRAGGAAARRRRRRLRRRRPARRVHVRALACGRSSRRTTRPTRRRSPTGLGALPDAAAAVGDLLLFNTEHNVRRWRRDRQPRAVRRRRRRARRRRRRRGRAARRARHRARRPDARDGADRVLGVQAPARRRPLARRAVDAPQPPQRRRPRVVGAGPAVDRAVADDVTRRKASRCPRWRRPTARRCRPPTAAKERRRRSPRARARRRRRRPSAGPARAAAAAEPEKPPPPGRSRTRRAAAAASPPPPAPRGAPPPEPPPPPAAGAEAAAGGGDEGGGERSALLAAIQKGKTLKKAGERVVKERKQQRSVSVDSGNASGGDFRWRRDAADEPAAQGDRGSRKGMEEEGAEIGRQEVVRRKMPTIGERSQTMPVLDNQSRRRRRRPDLDGRRHEGRRCRRTKNNRPPSDDGDDWSDPRLIR